MSDFRLVRRTAGPDGHDPAAAQRRLTARTLPPALHDFRRSAPQFQLDDALETAINTALAVGAPLLLTGEPGTGKTQVAYYLGWYFDVETFHFAVQSTSTADDLKYDFDAVAYLRAAQHPQSDPRRERHEFLQERPLWLAYRDPNVSVLLIDEIDKAPRDFPNDLLRELDKHEFAHPFLPETVVRPASGQPPIVVVTSNVERRLPDAFLRRCIYHHIELTEALVAAAVAARAGDFPRVAGEAREEALRRFWELRGEPLRKRPSTAELLAWLCILSARGTTVRELHDAALPELPALGALVKDRDDLDKLGRP